MFSAFYRDAIDRDARVLPVGMIHRDGNPFEGVPLDADDHACVDFRFCADKKMKWWIGLDSVGLMAYPTRKKTRRTAGRTKVCLIMVCFARPMRPRARRLFERRFRPSDCIRDMLAQGE